jgi:AbrB family looped-hinge helix DNA binding protein
MDKQRTDTVYFSVKGQVVIPRRLRRDFGIEQGTRAIVYRDGERIVLRPITLQHYRSMRGSLKGKGALKAMMAERNRERDL